MTKESVTIENETVGYRISDDSIRKLLDEKYKFEEMAKKYKECLEDISKYFVCVGGPLNDNILQFNKKQKKFLWEIYNEIKNILDDKDE